MFLAFAIHSLLMNDYLQVDKKESGTQIVVLGSGTPNPDPKHQGAGIAIISKGQTYLVDCGPGIVRQASASHAMGVLELDMKHLTRVFITHLHSDHTMGLPDLMFTPAVTGRQVGLSIFGPPGTKKMVNHIESAWAEDRNIRLHEGEPSVPDAYRFPVQEASDGWVYKDDIVRIKAFKVRHGHWKFALGYRIETSDRVIVISGDTTYSPELIENAKGCDVLIHEAYSEDGLKLRTPEWQAYHSTYHSSGPDVGRIAQIVQPKLLILYHELPFGQKDGQILKEVSTTYTGKVIEAVDLAIY